MALHKKTVRKEKAEEEYCFFFTLSDNLNYHANTLV
jgi:hypothetical protein